jgi:stalled ribosome rescue protein Dom34
MLHAAVPFHLLIWIDHQVANLFHVSQDKIVPMEVINAPDRGLGHVHHRAGTPGPGHAPVQAEFLERAARALRNAHQVLIVGPSTTRHALYDYIARHVPDLAKRVIAVEPMDRCGTQQMLEFSIPFFRQADRMNPP